MIVELDEEALQPFRRNFVRDAVRVKAGAGFLDRGFAQIRTENLNAGRSGAIGEIFQQDNRDGIHLFSRSAAGNPNS